MSTTTDPFQSVGVLKVIIQSAHIDSGTSWHRRRPSPFVVVQAATARARTSAQLDTYDPCWLEETFFLLVKSADEDVKLKLYDAHEHRKDRLLGVASFSVGGGLKAETQLALVRKRTGQRVGDLFCCLFYYPILREDQGSSGIVRLTIHRVEGLALPPRTSSGCNILASPTTKVKTIIRLGWNSAPVCATQETSLNADSAAVWESAHEFLCHDQSACVVHIEVWDAGDGVLVGSAVVGLKDMVEAKMETAWALADTSAAMMVASAEWRCVAFPF